MTWNVGRELREAIERYDRDVEAKAVKLIEGGCSPIEAMRIARDSVEFERRERTRKPSSGILCPLAAEVPLPDVNG